MRSTARPALTPISETLYPKPPTSHHSPATPTPHQQIILLNMIHLEQPLHRNVQHGSEAGWYAGPIDFVYHSTLGVRVMKKKQKKKTSPPPPINDFFCVQSRSDGLSSGNVYYTHAFHWKYISQTLIHKRKHRCCGEDDLRTLRLREGARPKSER